MIIVSFRSKPLIGDCNVWEKIEVAEVSLRSVFVEERDNYLKFYTRKSFNDKGAAAKEEVDNFGKVPDAAETLSVAAFIKVEMAWHVDIHWYYDLAD